MIFSLIPGVNMTRDLIQLKEATGGAIGQLNLGGTKLTALRLGPNLYVTTEKVPHTAKVMAEMNKADIHELKGHADIGHFMERYKAFKKGD